jgi:hypothetical protein
MRLICAIVLILGLALPAGAQTETGWFFSGNFNGSVNSAGLVTKVEPLVGYRFNDRLSAYGGLPLYFINMSSSEPSTAGAGFSSGIGNTFFGFRANVESDTVNYDSTVELTAPTGDESKGFSTGNVTVDWTNRFSRTFGSWTPFGSAGIANTVSDTSFFVRPFSSLGLVGHFEGGTTYDLSDAAWLGVSAYAVRGSGEQRVFSRLIERPAAPVTPRPIGALLRNRFFENQPLTVGQGETVNDHGFSTWFGVIPAPGVDFQVGYSRSVGYAYNSFFFGVGFQIP